MVFPYFRIINLELYLVSVEVTSGNYIMSELGYYKEQYSNACKQAELIVHIVINDCVLLMDAYHSNSIYGHISMFKLL